MLMTKFSSQSALLLLIFALCSFESESFSQQGIFRNSFDVATQFGRQHQVCQHDRAIASTTAISMGLVEDFVAGTDEKTRKSRNEKYLEKLQERVDRINGLEESIEDLGDDELQAKTISFRQRLENGEDINGPILEEAFAVVREAAW